FGWIDFRNLVVRFSHWYHTYILKGTITGRFSIMYGAELSRFILSSLVPEVTRRCRSFTKQLRRLNPQSTSRGHVARHHCHEQQPRGGGKERKRMGGRHADEQARNQAVSDIDAQRSD